MSPRRTEASNPAEHREPTRATVRQLYGTAFACAKPGCGAPLYKVNDDNGEHVLNSHVAHIHARHPRGARWDPQMSEDDNRAAANLLLLCFFHAWEIDNIAVLHPAELLRAWKHQQITDVEQARSTWTITDVQADEALVPLDLQQALDKIAALLPFNPGARTRPQAWQLAMRKAAGQRIARLTPLVHPEHRDAVISWMGANGDPPPHVPPGSVRVLVARMGAGKSEQALRWWEEGLQAAATSDDVSLGAYFTPRSVVPTTLESALITELGAEPAGPCRVVLDDLDSVTPQQAARLLAEARALVHVWPDVSILATSRPGVRVTDEELITLDPWPVDRGASLLRAALGEQHYWPHWNTETRELLTSPLTALGVAGRLRAGRDNKATRLQVLADLANLVLDLHHEHVGDETWQDLATLAMRILNQPEPVLAASFDTKPRIQRLLDTDMVLADAGSLIFALPVFEQYFDSEAIRCGLTTLDNTAHSDAFPRWRYALAFAVSTASPPEQERQLLELARINPAAAMWIIEEIRDSTVTAPQHDPSEQDIATLISRRDCTGVSTEPDPAVRAVTWLREAEQALLYGLGPLAPRLVRHRDGKLVQWGAWLQGGYVTVARARDRTPPPAVIKLAELRPKITISAGWHRVTWLQFPTASLGRWDLAQRTLQEQLEKLIRRRTLAVPDDSWLARERTFHLASYVNDFAVARPRRPILLTEVREKVNSWLKQVNASEWATWGGGKVDSDDVRWLAAQLERYSGEHLLRPWPDGDRPPSGRWAWQEYSPELTLTMATDIVREALTGYRQLVELNFPSFGDALGLYSMLPLHARGIIERPDDERHHSVEVTLMLHPGVGRDRSAQPTVEMALVTDMHASNVWEQGRQHWQRTTVTRFGQAPVQEVEVKFHVLRPATHLAYRWLVADLHALGWLPRDSHYYA